MITNMIWRYTVDMCHKHGTMLRGIAEADKSKPYPERSLMLCALLKLTSR